MISSLPRRQSYSQSAKRLAGRKRDAALFASVSLMALCLGLPAAAQSVTVSGPTLFGSLGGSYSYAYALSADGSTAVGEATTAGDNYYPCVSLDQRWRHGGSGHAGRQLFLCLRRQFQRVRYCGPVEHGRQQLRTCVPLDQRFGHDGSGHFGRLLFLLPRLQFRRLRRRGRGVHSPATITTMRSAGRAPRAWRIWARSGGTYSYANAVSSNGSVVVGEASTAGDNYDIMRSAGPAPSGIADLGTLGGTYSYAYALNSDGSVVVGEAYHSQR